MRGLRCKRGVRAASMLPEGSKAPAAFPRLRVTPDAPSGPPGFVRYGDRRPTTGDCRLPRAPPQAVVSELSSQRPRSGSRNGIGRIACLYFSDAVLRTSDRCRVDSSQRRLGDGGSCGRVVAPRSPSGSGQPRSGRRPSGACTRVRSGKISVDRPDWDHAQRRALRGFSGATLGQRLVQWFVAVGLSPAIAEIVGVGLVVAAITYVSLIVGELVPKQIALRDPERVAVRLAPAMTLLAKVASPAVWLLDVSGRLVLRVLGYGRQVEQRVTDEEIKTLIAEAETAGVIEPSERAMIAGVMRLGDRPVRAVMTPRRDVDMVDLSADQESIRRTILESIHSRLPVYDRVPDEMLGVLQAKDLLEAYLRDEPPELPACL